MQAIAHNLTSQFTNRQLNITTKNKAQSAERLSTGYRINRSGDDAAGLTISEKMRWQIRGLNKCNNNIQDGISLLQVADGAMNEITDMVHRLKELAVQGMNDTNTEADVAAIQKEMDALVDEIDSTAERTTFNGVSLLEGDFMRVTSTTVTTDVEEKKVKSTYITNGILPSWATVNGVPADSLTASDAKMVMNNSLVSSAATQKTYLEKYVTDANAPGGIRVETNWNADLSENYSAVIDFSALASVGGTTDVQVDDDVNGDGVIDTNDVVSANNVWLKLNELVNTGFTMGCCSCDERYGILFTTKDRENEIIKFTDEESQIYRWNRDKTDYQKVYIDELLEEAENNPNSGADIAEKLVQLVLDEAESEMGHFTHYTSDPNKPGALVVYDFRDNEQDVAGATIDTELWLKKVTDITIPAHTVDYTYYDTQVGLMIQTGAEKDDAVALHLYDVTSASTGLNLRGNVEILKKNYLYDVSTTSSTNTYTVQIPKYQSKTIPAYYNAHGEYVPARTELVPDGYDTKTITRTTTEQKKTLVGVSKDKNGKVLDNIDKALEKLNYARTSIGAQQNRLEYTKLIDNNTEENTQAAESRIRDTDMAEEMVQLSKHSILEQAGQSMLAQANQSQQGILTLLQ